MPTLKLLTVYGRKPNWRLSIRNKFLHGGYSERGVACVDADEITWITQEIAITNYFSAHQRDVLAEHQVEAILCLDRELRGDSPDARGVACIEVADLVDGPNDLAVFDRAVSSLASLLAKYRRVVVHCRAGRSRSIAVVAAYLKRSQGIEATDALEFVRSKRESALAPELIRLVERC